MSALDHYSCLSMALMIGRCSWVGNTFFNNWFQCTNGLLFSLMEYVNYLDGQYVRPCGVTPYYGHLVCKDIFVLCCVMVSAGDSLWDYLLSSVQTRNIFFSIKCTNGLPLRVNTIVIYRRLFNRRKLSPFRNSIAAIEENKTKKALTVIFLQNEMWSLKIYFSITLFRSYSRRPVLIPFWIGKSHISEIIIF